MFNSKKRPSAPTPSSGSNSTSKPFNPAHTHPASISSPTSIQTREHVSDAKSSSASTSKPAVPVEGIQSGGGGGGGAGAGSQEGIEGTGLEKDSKDERGTDDKWNDPKKVHPAWEGFGKGPKKEEKKIEKDAKAKL